MRLALACTLLAALVSCAPSAPEPLRLAVLWPGASTAMPMSTGMGMMMPMQMPMVRMSPPELTWALERVNGAGGVAGRPLVLDYIDSTSRDPRELARELIADERYQAVLGPIGSKDLAAITDLFVAAHKPLVSYVSAAADLLRAYGGKGVLWRTRQSDIAGAEVLVRFGREAGAQRLGLISTLDATGLSFFSWFGFFAKELGFPEDAVSVSTLEGEDCAAAVAEAVAARPDMLFLAASTPGQQQCVAEALSRVPGAPRLLLADTGLDPFSLLSLGPLAQRLEGFSAAGDDAYEAAFHDRFPGERLAPHGASGFDAVLLLAYGLAATGGEGGAALVAALRDLVNREGGETLGWDPEGVAAALAALARGERPRLLGAAGPLAFEPMLLMDRAGGTLAHYRMSPAGPVYDRRFPTGDGAFLSGGGGLVGGSAGLQSPLSESLWAPAASRGDTYALLGAFSEGWSNYRHQADVLRQYQILRRAGMDDDHIILVLADDLAGAQENQAPGTVRNAPGGPDLRAGAVIDYGLAVTGADLRAILLGQVSARTPRVLPLSASSNLYLFIAGHGGTAGVPIQASSTAAGLRGGGEVFSPALLRETLCTLRGEGRLRRALVVIESCYSGAFGAQAHGGLERGCEEGGQAAPLSGVLLMTAASSREVSYAGSYDPALAAWVSDAFAEQIAAQLEGASSSSLFELYRFVYPRVAGSHVSLFNSAAAGRITTVPVGEFR